MIRWAAAALLAVSASPAWGQDAPHHLRIVREAVQVALPNSGRRGEFTHKKGDLVLNLPLLWDRGAVVVDPVTIRADKDVAELKAGQALQAMVLADRSGNIMSAFCTQRRAGERTGLSSMLGGGAFWDKLARGMTDRQFCLIDSDDDGLAEMSVELNAGTDAARTPVAITPVRVKEARLVPISEQDRLLIKLLHIEKRGVIMQLDVVQRGKSREFSSFAGTTPYFDISIKNGSPQSVTVAGASFELVSVDHPNKVATFRWPEHVAATFVLPIPDQTEIVRRLY